MAIQLEKKASRIFVQLAIACCKAFPSNSFDCLQYAKTAGKTARDQTLELGKPGNEAKGNTHLFTYSFGLVLVGPCMWQMLEAYYL